MFGKVQASEHYKYYGKHGGGRGRAERVVFSNTKHYDIKWFHALVSSRYTLTSECKLRRWQREIQSVDS